MVAPINASTKFARQATARNIANRGLLMDQNPSQEAGGPIPKDVASKPWAYKKTTRGPAEQYIKRFANNPNAGELKTGYKQNYTMKVKPTASEQTAANRTAGAQRQAAARRAAMTAQIARLNSARAAAPAAARPASGASNTAYRPAPTAAAPRQSSGAGMGANRRV